MKEGYFPSAQTFRGFRRGWRANHFPLRGDDVMTIHVALSRIGLRPEHRFAFAVDVTDTQSEWQPDATKRDETEKTNRPGTP